MLYPLNIGRNESNGKIEEIMEPIRKKEELMRVLGDLNAKCTLWEESVQDAISEYLAHKIAGYGCGNE